MGKHKMRPDREYYREVLKLLGFLTDKDIYTPYLERQLKRVLLGTKLRLDYSLSRYSIPQGPAKLVVTAFGAGGSGGKGVKYDGVTYRTDDGILHHFGAGFDSHGKEVRKTYNPRTKTYRFESVGKPKRAAVTEDGPELRGGEILIHEYY